MPLRFAFALAALAAACLAALAGAVERSGPAELRVAAIGLPRVPARAKAPSPRSSAAARPSGVAVAIVDTGVAAVPGLAPNLRAGWDFVDGDAVAEDGNGHGTAMASIAAGRSTGVCPACAILPVRVVGSAGLGTAAAAAQGIRWAADNGARVVNMSLTTRSSDRALREAIAEVTARGVVVVLAAGNAGSTDPGAGGYPAAVAPEAVTVAGADATGRVYAWSNRGAWVDVAAPGRLPALDTAGRTVTTQGSSAAAAYVSGVVGRLLSRNPALGPAEVHALLLRAGFAVEGLDVASGRMLDAASVLAAFP